MFTNPIPHRAAPVIFQRTPCALALAFVLAVAGCSQAQQTDTPKKESTKDAVKGGPAAKGAVERTVAAKAEARAAAAGQLVIIKRQKVLRLFGPDAKERGFAHGYLLGDEFMACIADAFASLPFFTKEKHNTRLRPWAIHCFVWDAEARAEIEGLYEGLCARVGKKGLHSAFLGRALEQEDLYAVNVIADYFGPGCSGFTATDNLTEDGKVIHGRNLDFPLGNNASARQVVFAVDALPKTGDRPVRRAWVGVGWPGLISIYSAMNADGFVCCLHDAYNVIRGGPQKGYVPRGLLLRRMVESVDPAAADPAESAKKMAAARPVACGNLFHLSWPAKAARITKTRPAAVLEFDAMGRDGQGTPVHVRRMDASNYLVVTNHYRERARPVKCDRYDRINEAPAALRKEGKKIDLQIARKILVSAEQTVAAHTLVFWPDDRKLNVSISVGNLLSTRRPGVQLTWQELFTRSAERGASSEKGAGTKE
jgi:hypothetical protein